VFFLFHKLRFPFIISSLQPLPLQRTFLFQSKQLNYNRTLYSESITMAEQVERNGCLAVSSKRLDFPPHFCRFHLTSLHQNTPNYPKSYHALSALRDSILNTFSLLYIVSILPNLHITSIYNPKPPSMTLQYLHDTPCVNERLANGLAPTSQVDLGMLERKLQEMVDRLDPTIVPPSRKMKL